jgi:hypothetical protein
LSSKTNKTVDTRPFTATIMPIQIEIPTNINVDLHFITEMTDLALQDQTYCFKAAHFLDIGGSATEDVLQISVFHRFCETMCSSIDAHPNMPIVVCPKDQDVSSLSTACQLLGAYLILEHDCQVNRVQDICRPILDEIARRKPKQPPDIPGPHDSCMIDCWHALDQAKSLTWLTSSDAKTESILDVEMAAHYAMPANGNIHVLVPGKLLLFPTPAPLPVGLDWADESDGGQAAERRFGASFLAGLLAELEVSAVVCLGRADERDAAAFGASELDVHELGLGKGRAGLLGAMDHLLAVSRAAPGAVAVYGGGAGDSEALETMVAAWVMRECGFGAGAGAAWVRMVCPHAGF